MTTTYNALIEFNHRADTMLDGDVDTLMTALQEYHPAVGGSARGWLEVTITLPADNLSQATTTALAVTTEAVRRVAFTRQAIAASVLTTEEFDARHGMTPLPDLLSTEEAAEVLGVSRQRVGQLVDAGHLQGERVGRALVLPRTAVETFAQRDRGPGRPAKAR